MKRMLLLITFFVGLIPNIKKMELESVYSIKSQILYNENETNTPSCVFCMGDVIEEGSGTEKVYYCPICQFYCEKCNEAFSIGFQDTHICEDNENEDEDNENEDEDEDSTSSSMSYLCLQCKIYLSSEERKKAHQDTYGHIYFKPIKN